MSLMACQTLHQPVVCTEWEQQCVGEVNDVAPKQEAARREAGLPVGEAWFEAAAGGSHAAGHTAHALKHSEFSAGLAEGVYCAAAQALALLCASAPEVRGVAMIVPCLNPKSVDTLSHVAGHTAHALKHSKFSAGLAEGVYCAAAQALALLCASAPEVRGVCVVVHAWHT